MYLVAWGTLSQSCQLFPNNIMNYIPISWGTISRSYDWLLLGQSVVLVLVDTVINQLLTKEMVKLPIKYSLGSRNPQKLLLVSVFSPTLAKSCDCYQNMN